jgi:hypothetical protein
MGGPDIAGNQDMFLCSFLLFVVIGWEHDLCRFAVIALQSFSIGDIVAVALLTRVYIPTEYVFEHADPLSGILRTEYYDFLPNSVPNFSTLDVGSFVTGGDRIPISSAIVPCIHATSATQRANVRILFWRAVHTRFNNLDQLLVPIVAIETINRRDIVRCEILAQQNSAAYRERASANVNEEVP